MAYTGIRVASSAADLCIHRNTPSQEKFESSSDFENSPRSVLVFSFHVQKEL